MVVQTLLINIVIVVLKSWHVTFLWRKPCDTTVGGILLYATVHLICTEHPYGV